MSAINYVIYRELKSLLVRDKNRHPFPDREIPFLY